ncbi:hypothetical protein [Actinomadura rupiterrae]|uniref:hypothetical protein n=1 Tax=Actinomadura rupiterrae TaxID=559627 RepID=UPI0020A3D512|nr:hypothetical protein [Actinomadura rupiterrae]MCP2342659.1 hypothetical protein [Actinomadura rupiterrae]
MPHPSKPAPKPPARPRIHGPHHPIAVIHPQRKAGFGAPLVTVVLAVVISAGVATLFAH